MKHIIKRETYYGITFYPFGRIVKARGFNREIYYQVKLAFSSKLIDLAVSKEKIKGLNAISVSIVSATLNLVWAPLILISYPIFRYFRGGYWFFKNVSWVQDVRYFNLINTFLLIGLVIFLLWPLN